MDKKRTISITLGIIFSAVGLYLAFRNVPVSSLWHYALQLNYGWAVPAAAALTGAYLIRSVRWQWLLLPAGRVSLANAYHSLIISMMINCLLPGRVGELARPMVLKKRANFPLATSIAALGVERLLDLLALLLLLLPTTFALAPDAETAISFGNQQLSRALLIDLGYISLLVAIGLMVAVYMVGHDRLRQFAIVRLKRLPAFFLCLHLKRPADWLDQGIPLVADFIERSAHGVKYILTFKGFIGAVSISLAFWGFNALSFYFLSLGSPGIELNFMDICGVMVIICFFIALPSVPGFWGLWEAAGVLALSYHGVARDAAAGFSLFSHAFHIFPVIIAGWVSCMILGFRWTGLKNPSVADHSQA